MSTLAQLRPHQTQSLDGLRDALRTGARRVVLQAPTGFGKTVVAAHIVAGCRERSKRVTFCVPSLGLVDQTFERFLENGIEASDMGVIQADHPWRRPHAPVQIATAQTLSRREPPVTDVVVVDEAHIQHEVYERWMEAEPGKIFIGLSATPWARGMGRRWQVLVPSISLQDLIDQGYLSRFRVFAPSSPDLTGVATVRGDYHEGQLAKRMNRPQLVADIVQTWIERGENRPTLCFATGREHAQAIAARFAEFGISVAYVDANTPRQDRERIGRELAAGEVRVVVNIGTLTTGIDWDVRCIILARPTKSRILFVQIVGRGLRTADGKADCIILDHSDTHHRLGMVTDIHRDTLCTGKLTRAEREREEAEERIPKPRCCPACMALMAATERVCGECGAELPRPQLESSEGSLEEFTGAKPRPKRKRGEKATDVLRAMGKEEVFAQLTAVMIDRQRSTGWRAHAYREIFDAWPRNLDHLQPSPVVSYEVAQFVRAKDIRYAKSRAKAASEVTHGAA